MLSLNDARFLISDKLKAGQPIVLPTREAANHALATDVFVQEDFPAFSNSAMDGYAVRKSDLRVYQYHSRFQWNWQRGHRKIDY